MLPVAIMILVTALVMVVSTLTEAGKGLIEKTRARNSALGRRGGWLRHWDTRLAERNELVEFPSIQPYALASGAAIDRDPKSLNLFHFVIANRTLHRVFSSLRLIDRSVRGCRNRRRRKHRLGFGLGFGRTAVGLRTKVTTPSLNIP
jgi:hypothetical protein